MNDDYSRVNPILRRIMAEIYRKRTPLPKENLTNVRMERVRDQAFCEIWFMTPGCSHDALGGCTMCNYGKGCAVTATEVLNELRLRIEALPHRLQELIVTPTGSMLDEREVPAALREQIFQLLRRPGCRDFFVETRADTITPEKLESMKRHVRAERLHIEIGVECCQDWVLRNCINKNMKYTDIGAAVDLIHGAQMYACANVGIGIPFLSERCSIELAKRSIHQLFAAGVDYAVLFPYHVKPGRLSAWLWERQLYQCCSLWAVVEVLSDFTAEELERVQISWYRNYYEQEGKVLTSPAAAPDCMEEVLSLLDQYKNYPGAASLAPLLAFSGGDRAEWRRALLSQPEGIVFYAVREKYCLLASYFDIPASALKTELNYMRRTLESDCFD